MPAALDLCSQLATSNSSTDTTAATPYLLNLAAICEVNDIIVEAASVCMTSASPAVLAWGVILQTVRESAQGNKESRELLQSQRALDRYGPAEPSDNDLVEKTSQRRGAFASRRSSSGSDNSQQSSFLEEILDRIMDTTLDQDPISFLAKSAVDGSHVLDIVSTLAMDFCTPYGAEQDSKVGIVMRRVLLDLIRATLDWIPYQPELLMAALAVLTGSEGYWDLCERTQVPEVPEPGELFLTDKLFLQRLLAPAQSRFPHESLPFFKLCRALAIKLSSSSEQLSPIWHRLEFIDSFTCALPPEFRGYELIREDEDANYIQLTEDFGFMTFRSGISSIPPQKSAKLSHALITSAQSSCLQEIPKGTIGRVVSETRPFVVLWRLDYHGFEYLGKVLMLASLNDHMALDAGVTVFSREVVAEILDLINSMIASVMQSGHPEREQDVDAARNILERTSDGLDRNDDLISIVFGLFEDELYRRRKVSEAGGTGDILVRCMQFIHAIIPIMPDRVWPFLARSGLLGLTGGESQLGNIVTAIEMITGQYDFLFGCICVFESLVQDAITHAVSRKLPTKTVTRFGSIGNSGNGIPLTTMKAILLAFTRSMVDVFLSTMNWKFLNPGERLEINNRISNIFTKILTHCYTINDSKTLGQKVIESLAPSAEYLVNAYLLSNPDMVINSLLHIFTEGVITPDTTLAFRSLHYWTLQVRSALQLSTTLIRVSCLIQSQPGAFEKRLFGAASVLVKLYVAHESYKLPAIELLDVLVTAMASTEGQPPSLLSNLGEGAASDFLEVISVLDRPFDNAALSVGIWRFLAAIVSKRQQWFAIFLLTGRSPRETVKDRKTATDKPRALEPFLGIALDQLLNMKALQPQIALSILEFVALALEYWPWVMTVVEQHPKFLTALQDFLSGMDTPPGEQGPTFSEYINIQICSYAIDILAVACQHSQHMGNTRFSKDLISKLSYLEKNAVLVPKYNASLHSKLRQNFEAKFTVCHLADFKRTTFKRPSLGSSFYYDLDIADELLSFDPAWSGRRGDGFIDEIKRANINLSVVESQVNLLYSWKCLAIQLSRSMGTDQGFQETMLTIIVDCLRSNIAESNLNVAVFEKLAQTRAELAFALLQRLNEAKVTGLDYRSILPVAWDAVRNYDIDVEAALRSDDADYYRLLLKLLCLAIQEYVTHSPGKTDQFDTSTPTKISTSPTTTQIILEIITHTVARGFRGLTTLLHDTSSLVEPSDFVLITAILRTSLLIPGITRNTAHLLTSFSDASTARCASTLLSWSDQMATNNDPIYGELSILFLLELSNVPSLAESLAVDSVLPQITSTNLMTFLRQSKTLGPFDPPVRIYSIWSRGLLPLFLNLLHAVGPPIAAEIAGVVNSFPEQLARASNAFDTDTKSTTISLSMTSEAQTLAIILVILDAYREAGASAGIVAADVAEVKWDRAQVKDDIETWLGKRAILRDVIAPTSGSEEILLRTPAAGKGEAENRLEEKVVEALQEVVALLSNGER